MAFPSDLSRTKNWGTETLLDTDLEGQFDLIINWVMAALDASTGHDHAGTSNTSKKISVTNLGTGVYPAANVATVANIMAFVYPVGSVVTLGVSTNPATLFGVGTWTAIAGKVIVGINAGDTEFDTLNETGGAKTVTLDATMIPEHTHTVTAALSASGGGNGELEGSYGNGHVIVEPATTSTGSGGGLAHNNLQPYIVKYVWERTA